jgi:hypothetical protein
MIHDCSPRKVLGDKGPPTYVQETAPDDGGPAAAVRGWEDQDSAGDTALAHLHGTCTRLFIAVPSQPLEVVFILAHRGARRRTPRQHLAPERTGS